jgi:hypothetical protein
MLDPLDPAGSQRMPSLVSRTANQPSELFHISWKDHPIDITSNLRSLRTSEALSDVTLVCTTDGRTSSKAVEVAFRAHKIVLASASSFFARLLTSLSVNNGSSLVLVMTDVEPGMLDLVLRFIYDGSVNVDSGLVDGFMKACEKLEIRGLAASAGDEQESNCLEAVRASDGSDNCRVSASGKAVGKKRRFVGEDEEDQSLSTVKAQVAAFEVLHDEGTTDGVNSNEEGSLEVCISETSV